MHISNRCLAKSKASITIDKGKDVALDLGNPSGDDTYPLYDLRIEVMARKTPQGEGAKFVCKHKRGDYFEVRGEMLSLPHGQPFSMYALAALLPFLPAKQRVLHENDWMFTDTDIACPDPNCGAMFRISRIDTRTEHHSEATVVPLKKK